MILQKHLEQQIKPKLLVLMELQVSMEHILEHIQALTDLQILEA